jgi:hypothetical protein
VVAARPHTRSPATAPLARLNLETVPLTRSDLEATPLSRLDPAVGGGDAASSGGLESPPWWPVTAEGGDVDYDNDSDQEVRQRAMAMVSLDFIFFVFFRAGDISHPQIFACGCVTRTKKIRFLQTLGANGWVIRTQKSFLTLQKNRFRIIVIDHCSMLVKPLLHSLISIFCLTTFQTHCLVFSISPK